MSMFAGTVTALAMAQRLRRKTTRIEVRWMFIFVLHVMGKRRPASVPGTKSTVAIAPIAAPTDVRRKTSLYDICSPSRIYPSCRDHHRERGSYVTSRAIGCWRRRPASYLCNGPPAWAVRDVTQPGTPDG